MRLFRIALVVFTSLTGGSALLAQWGSALSSLPEPRDYVLKRVSSYDRSGGNADYRTIEPGATLTVLDEPGPGIITHVWFTLEDEEVYHLKKIVLRMYLDGESTPSVETPLGDYSKTSSKLPTRQRRRSSESGNPQKTSPATKR